MNGGGEAGRDFQCAARHDRQFAVTVFGSRKIRRDARKAEAGRAAFQAVQQFAKTFGRVGRKIGEGLREQCPKLEQSLLAEQREELGNARLVDVLHCNEPR